VEVAALLEQLSGLPGGVLFALLLGGSLVEYVFPPFPGDTVVLAGAVLAAAGALGLPWVFVAVTVGAVVGTAIDWWAGRKAADQLHRLSAKRRATVDKLVRGFERFGPVLLVLNRFAPGIRALFFVAAGVAGLRLWVVVAWSTVSATLWNALLIGIGTWAGWNLDRLVPLTGKVGWAGAVVVGLVVLAWLWVSLRGDDEGSVDA
jgi:membrane protein DedA with SNARE-associated domain